MRRPAPGYLIGATVLTLAGAVLVDQGVTSFKSPPPRPTVVLAAAAPANAATDVASFAFPATIKVAEGGTVTWTNTDPAPHTVSFDDETIGNDPLPPGASQKLSFAKKGTYTYHCEIHTSMTGTVEVVGATTVTNADPYADPYATQPTDPYGGKA